jgi:hypothetical protein
MIITHFVSDGFNEYNSSRWRVSNTTDVLLEAGHEVHILSIQEWIGQTPHARFITNKSDITFIHRVSVRDSIKAIEYWTKRKKAIVLDFDDSYDNLVGDTNPAKKFWIDGVVQVRNRAGQTSEKVLEEHPINTLKEAISKCTATTVPSYRLVSDWARFGTVVYIENYINSDMYIDITKFPRNDSTIRIGWGGSLGHIDSFKNSGVIDAIDTLMKEYSDIVFFLIGDKRITDLLPFKNRVMFHPYVTYKEWPSVITKYDIGIAPLAGEFDKRRSPIKLTEYCTAAIPFAATYDLSEGYAVYHNYKDANGFLIPNGAESWYNAIKDLFLNIEDHRRMAKENIHIAEKYFAKNNVAKLIGTYRDIIDLV